MNYSGLIRLHHELEVAAKNKTLDPKRRELAVLLLDEIDGSQVDGFEPSTKPTDGWLATDVICQQTQSEMWTSVELQNRWHVPTKIWDTKPKPTSPVPLVPKENETPDFDFEEE